MKKKLCGLVFNTTLNLSKEQVVENYLYANVFTKFNPSDKKWFKEIYVESIKTRKKTTSFFQFISPKFSDKIYPNDQ